MFPSLTCINFWILIKHVEHGNVEIPHTAREHERILGGWLDWADALVVFGNRFSTVHAVFTSHGAFVGGLNFLGWLLPVWWGSSHQWLWTWWVFSGYAWTPILFSSLHCCPCNSADMLSGLGPHPLFSPWAHTFTKRSHHIGPEELFFLVVVVMCVVCLCGVCMWQFVWMCRAALNSWSSFLIQ